MGEKDLQQKTIYLNGSIVGEIGLTGDHQRDIQVTRDFLKSKGLYKEVVKVIEKGGRGARI